MEWIGSLIGGIFSQALSAYFWSKTVSLALVAILGLGSASVALALIWLVAKQPKAGLIFFSMALVAVLTVGVVYRPLKAQCPTVPAPYKGHNEVSARWASTEGVWRRYWTDRHIPKEWKPYQALVRVRIGDNDLYMVFGAGRVLVIGEDLNVKAVEPISGT